MLVATLFFLASATVSPADASEQPAAELTRADYVMMARQAARSEGVDPDAFVALVSAESAFDPNAISPKGARGLAQLMLGTASDLGIPADKIDDPTFNLRGGARYLKMQLDTFGSLPLALAAYNAGPGRAAKPASSWPRETKGYVTKILTQLGREAEIPLFETTPLIFASAGSSSSGFIGGIGKSRPDPSPAPSEEENPDA
jgi:soluble lytic murein transglycosylase-like protein